jgi:hypothetical protein
MFGKTDIVTTKKKIQGKIKDHGTVWMVVGYPTNHPCGVYRIINIKTNHIVKRDIV